MINSEHIYMNYHDIQQKYKRYFQNKRVSIVGPASYIDEIKQSDLVDSYDDVVRFIRFIPVPERLAKNIGSKTNFIVSSLCGDRGIINNSFIRNSIDIIKKHGGRILATHPAGYFHTINETLNYFKNNDDFEIIIIEKGKFDPFKKELGSNPTTGIAAINFLLSYDIKELYVTGFTFNCDKCPRIKEYVEKCIDKNIDRSGWHNYANEEDYFNKLYKRDHRLKIDKYMKEKVIA